VLAGAGLALVAWFAATKLDWAEVAAEVRDASPALVAASFLVNLVSLSIRGAGWIVCARGAVPQRLPFAAGERAFMIGQGINTVVPGRVGEPAKALVAQRHLAPGAATFTALLGSIAAHRLMDVVPLTLVSIVVLAFGDLPSSLTTSVVLTVGISIAGLALGGWLASRGHMLRAERRVVRILGHLAQGFRVLHRRHTLAVAVTLETVGWCVQIAVVWLGFRAMDIDAGLVSAAAVVIATNAATLVPLWPGNVGLFQVAVALALTPAGVPESLGVAFGLVLQGIEASSALLAGGAAAAAEGLRPAEVRLLTHARAEAETPSPQPGRP
jgi:phosphatidylinositol alpha-mannosyltransferase